MYYIYKHTSPSGKSYIGQTNNISRRIIEHRSSDKCRAFHNAIQKYGWDSFVTEILATVQTIEESNELETKFITEHNTLTPNGYNLTSGGDNKIISEETRLLISQAKQGAKNPQFGKDPWNKGLTKETSSIIQEKTNRWLENYQPENHPHFNKPRSEETKQKISIGLSGIPKSTEHKQKLSNVNKGKVLSEETKQKMSQSRKGQICPILTCPHCGKLGKGSAMYKWHFDNCRSKLYSVMHTNHYAL
ncbi:MAG: hypothetical protein CTY12_03325 [Methylotenera sp.]|nr:MAG: hypothetical protein CTY12_03325 [Methylotenera sp.]